ncbi:hypothetical protein [Kordia zhangzhouensis]|uniref:hypothetical protein n=1 Tax=Kordia zhangzhouensis TaxID=1620405 RepID=UPI0009E2E696|nr:hypothetical protein [Kordia zhangzhouensis]
MRQTITKSQKNKQILNKLIIDGYYNGSISPERFELTRNHFPNNHRIIGILNDDGNYDLKFDFTYPLSILVYFLLGFVFLISIIFLIKGVWGLPVILIILGLIIFIDFKLKERKEITLFTDTILELHKNEFD